MSKPGSLVEVQVTSLGSHLVGIHLSGATTLLVDDPTPFDTDGGEIEVDGAVYSYTEVEQVPDAVDPAERNAELTLDTGLANDVGDLTPVELWNGSQVLTDVVLLVSTGEGGDPPIPVTLTALQRSFWEAAQGPVDPPIDVLLSDDLTQLEDAPGYTPGVNIGAITIGQPGTGRRISGLDFGGFLGTTDVDGRVTIPHDLGTIPVAAMLQDVVTGPHTTKLRRFTKTDNEVVVQVVNSATGDPVGSGVNVLIDWVFFA